MTGLAKFSDKEKRKQRRQYERDRLLKDLGSPKYRQRVIDRKRIEDEDGNLYFQDQYVEDDDE